MSIHFARSQGRFSRQTGPTEHLRTYVVSTGETMNNPADAENTYPQDDTMVRITVRGHLAQVVPSCDQILEPDLRYSRREYRADGPRGVACSSRSFRLFGCREDGHGVFPAGLVDRVAARLTASGRTVQITDVTPANKRLVIKRSAARPATDAEDALAECVLGRARGQITYRRKLDQTNSLAALTRLFPRACITIATATRPAAKAIRRSLSRRLSEAIGLYTEGRRRSHERLRVGTFGSLDPGMGDLIIAADATESLGVSATDFLTAIRDQKLFAFVPDFAPMSRSERLRIEALFGPIVFMLGGGRGSVRDVRVLVADAPPFRQRSVKLDVTWKRESIWHNAARNQAVATLALALGDGDAESLVRYGRCVFSWDERSGCVSAERRIVVLVESPEHGRELARLLPGWPLLVGPIATDTDNSLTPATTPGNDSTAHAPWPARSIMTLLHASSLRRLDIDVLIRTDGTPWPLRLPGFPPKQLGHTEPVLLIDLADDAENEPGPALVERLRDYQKRDWAIEGPTRILSYLQAGPSPEALGHRRKPTAGHRVRGTGFGR